MSSLWQTLDSLDEKGLDDLLQLLKKSPEEIPIGEKRNTILNEMYRIADIEPFLGLEALARASLKITGEFIEMQEVDWTRTPESVIVDAIYTHYQKDLKGQLLLMKPEKREKLLVAYQAHLKKEDKILFTQEQSQVATLEGGGHLFTSSAISIAALGFSMQSILGLILPYWAFLAFGGGFGPIGWAVTLALLGLGRIKILRHRTTSRLVHLVINLIVEQKRQYELALQNKYIDYYARLVYEAEEHLQLLQDLSKFVAHIDETPEDVEEERWYQNVLNALPEGTSKYVD